MDVSDGGRVSRQNHNGLSMSDCHRRSGEEHIDLVLFYGTLVRNRTDILADTFALTRQNGLVNAEAVALDGNQTAVGRNLVAHGDVYDVSRHEFIGADADQVAVTNGLSFTRRVLVEGRDGLLGTALLRDTDNGIENEDG